MHKDDQIREVKEKLARKASIFKQVFNSPDGQAVLAALEEEFNAADIFKQGQPDTTVYNLGRRDVVIYIKQLLEYGKNEN